MFGAVGMERMYFACEKDMHLGAECYVLNISVLSEFLY